jgi:membrane protease subunit HflC
MKPSVAISLAAGLLLAIVLFASTYVVREWEQVIITQFGEPVGEPITEPGLHLKLPFIQAVNRFDRRILAWDGKRNQIPTAEKQPIYVDTTARWRIKDPLLFLRAVRTQVGAQMRLDATLDGATRRVISSHNLIELVRLTNRVLDLPPEDEEMSQSTLEGRARIETGRNEIVEEILAKASGLALEYGIELIDVRIKRINYVPKVRKAVYDRMISELQRIEQRYRSEGQGKKQEIEGQRERDEKKISSEAFRQAQELIAAADAEAARIYAEAYNLDPDFYAFWRTLKAYETIIGPNHTLVLQPDSDLYRYLTEVGAK